MSGIHFSRIVPGAVLFLIFFICFCSAPVSAISVTESPDHIAKGERVTLSLHDVKNNSVFSILIEGRFPATPGSPFTLAENDFSMPISLGNGQIFASTENSRETTLLVDNGETLTSVKKDADANGKVSFSENRAIDAGTYDVVSISGTILPEKTSLITRLQLSGIKSGPENSEISFNVDGMDSGTLIVTVLVDDHQQLFQEITIGNGISVNPHSTFPGYTNEARDLDGDGKYEDLNGNGRMDFDDVIVLFSNMEQIQSGSHIYEFDFNKNGRIDFDDVITLFDKI